MTKDMTQGRPLPLILQFALPLLVGNFLQQAYNMIDAMIVGRYLGTGALAGVGASSSVQFLIIGFCLGTCSGFGVPVAQAFGGGDLRKMRDHIYHAAVLAVIIGTILTVTCAVFCHQILYILSTPEDIYDDAYRYLLIIFLGIPFTLLYNLLASILRAVGDSRTPFIFLAISTCLNIGLDLFCIVVLHWGVAGAAIATISAQAISGICCLVFIIKKASILHLQKENRRFTKDGAATMIMMGVPMGLQFSITAIGSMVMQSANNGLGSIYVSGFTAGAKIKMFIMCPFEALANGVSVFCSQNLGARKTERIRKGFVQGVSVAVGYGIVAGLILIFGGRSLSGLFVSQDESAVLDAAAQYLRCMGYFYWSLGFLNVCRLTTQGLGFAGRAIVGGILEMIARTFVSFVFVGIYGYSAICYADQTAWMMATMYIVPTCLYCIRKVCREVEELTYE